jgi:hypothetical protein
MELTWGHEHKYMGLTNQGKALDGELLLKGELVDCLPEVLHAARQAEQV